MRHSELSPCPGCGALFPPHDGPLHRYIGASAACWAMFSWSQAGGGSDPTGLIARSRIPDNPVPVPAHGDAVSTDALWGDAYGVQHHGGDSPQAVQSVAVHLLDLHAIISGQTTRPGWAIERALVPCDHRAPRRRRGCGVSAQRSTMETAEPGRLFSSRRSARTKRPGWCCPSRSRSGSSR